MTGVFVAERLQLPHEPAADLRRERAGDLVATELYPRQVVVMPDAADAESQLADRLLGTLDHPQLLVAHLGVIRNARGQTG